jgi:hypothetical protein
MLAALNEQEQAELARLLRKLLVGLEQQFRLHPPQAAPQPRRDRRQPPSRQRRRGAQNSTGPSRACGLIVLTLDGARISAITCSSERSSIRSDEFWS